MRKLTEVEEATALMNEAVEWSVMRWLKEKKRVRKIADRANDALDQSMEQTKARWSQDLLAAYAELAGPEIAKDARTADGGLRAFAKEMKRAAEDAYRARMDAEDTFDEAESQLSTRLAREGCRKAIYSWDLHEKAIRKAETAIGSRQFAS